MPLPMTVLQTLDSERYKPEQAANWAIDVAHVRSEIVTTLLGGNRVLVTANDVGDSPAFQRLLFEIMASGEEVISKFNAKREPSDKFNPFILGIESQYKDVDGQRGYAGFVARRRQKEIDKHEAGQVTDNLKGIGDISNKTGLSQYEVVRGMASAYLDIQNPAVARLKSVQPAVWEYARLVRRLFHYDAIGYDSAAYCPGNPFTDGKSINYNASLTRLAEIGAERTEDRDRAHKIEQRIIEITSSGKALASRADWTNFLPSFNENASIVRDWLDFILFDRVFLAFSSDDQVFFTQQCEPDEEENRFRMAVLSDGAFQKFERENRDDPGRMRPAVETPPWDWLLPLILSDDFRTSVILMNDQIAAAENWPQAEDRNRAKGDAVRAHIARLAEYTKRVTVIERNGMIADIQVSPEPLAVVWQEFAKASGQGAATFLGTAAIGVNAPLAAMTGMGVAATLAGVGILGAVDKLRRPKQVPGSPFAINLAAEPDHINWRVRKF